MNKGKCEKIEFSCLCFDKDNQCVFGDEPSRLALSLKSNVSLFPKNTTIKDIDASNSLLNDNDNNLTLTVTKLTGSAFLDYTVAFYLKCEISSAEKNTTHFNSFRLNIVSYLIEQKLGKIYITKDDLSSFLLNDLYMKMNKVENLLRSYITKHFSMTEGVSYWFNQVLDNEVKNKAGKRRNNEDVFSTLVEENEKKNFVIDTRMYLIDFEDLGNIIYANSFGNLKIEDLINKIENSENLDNLKLSVKNNIERYFQSFKDIEFQKKWDFLKSIRHKIAHNGLISTDQKEKADQYLDELIKFVEEKDIEKNGQMLNIDTFIDIEKREYSYTDSHYKEITKNALMQELASYQKWSQNIGRDFLGLKNFLYNRLGGMDYQIGKAWDKLEDLEKEGYIAFYEWKDPKGMYTDQKAIKILKDLPVWTV